MSLSLWEKLLYGGKADVPTGRSSSSTVNVAAYRLVKGAMVLTQSTPYRYKVEEVRWIEKPRFGSIVANLEGTDPETGAPTKRWHEWKPSDRVTVFVADVDLDEHGGSYENLLARYAQPAGEQQQEAEDGQWQRVSKLTFPE